MQLKTFAIGLGFLIGIVGFLLLTGWKVVWPKPPTLGERIEEILEGPTHEIVSRVRAKCPVAHVDPIAYWYHCGENLYVAEHTYQTHDVRFLECGPGVCYGIGEVWLDAGVNAINPYAFHRIGKCAADAEHISCTLKHGKTE